MATFLKFIPLLLQLEGGYQKMSQDNGNYNSLGQLVGTNKGISAPVYESWIGRPPTIEDMKNISDDTAKTIYKRNYWDKIKADLIYSQEVANIIADHGVNAGTGSAAKIIQRVLNEQFNKNLAVDGAIGNQTILAINSVEPAPLQSAILAARERYYKSLNQPYFLQGWLNRLKPFYEDAMNLASQYKKPFGIGLFVFSSLALTTFFF